MSPVRADSASIDCDACRSRRFNKYVTLPITTFRTAPVASSLMPGRVVTESYASITLFVLLVRPAIIIQTQLCTNPEFCIEPVGIELLPFELFIEFVNEFL